MKPVRVILISATAVLAVALVGLTLALLPGVQTWLVHRTLARHPDLHLVIGRVEAGFHRVALTDVRYAAAGVEIVAPRITAELAVLPAIFSHDLRISNLVADGWRVTIPAVARATSSRPAGASPAASAKEGNGEFRGLLPPVTLPFDLSAETMQLRGKLLLPAADASADVRITGGGLGVGREARFAIAGTATRGAGAVKSLGVQGMLRVRMDTARTFSEAAAELETSAEGPQLPAAVVMRVRAEVRKEGEGEAYAVLARQGDRELIDLRGRHAGREKRIGGEWHANLRDAEVAPFMLVRSLPQFTLSGSGRLDCDTAFTDVRATGKVEGFVDQLGSLHPALRVAGPVRLSADIDLAQRGAVLAITTLNVDVSAAGPGTASAGGGARPVGAIRALQAFEFNAATAELRAADPDGELVGVRMIGVPLAWLRPLAPELTFSGGDLRGEFVATPRAGGVTFRSKAPLSIAGLNLGRAGQSWLRSVDVALNASGDYTPRGWQAEISGFTARGGDGPLLLLDAKAGRLAEAGEPVKATGLLTIDLAAAMAQPWAKSGISLQKGAATVEFVASLGPNAQVQANVALRNLAVDPKIASEPLPTVTAAIRADIADGGVVAFSAPVSFERGGRISDLSVSGRYIPTARPVEPAAHAADPGGTFEARIASNNLVVDDVRAFSALRTAQVTGSGAADDAPGAPAWSSLNGTIGLQLKKVVTSGSYVLSNVTGTLRMSGGAVRIDQVQSGVGDAGEATVNGTVRFESLDAKPYLLDASVSLTDFEAGPVFLGLNPLQPPTIEGRFSIATNVTARAARLRDLFPAAAGDFEVTGRGGTFRGLAMNVGNLEENSRKLANWLASAGNAITAIAGRKDEEDIGSRSQAANELAKILSAIAYDQLAMRVSRNDALNAEIREISLISPEIRLNGSGRLRRMPGRALGNDTIDLELHLRARGRPAELMKYLGVLDVRTDDLGYAACTIPVRLEGSVGKPDTTELSNRLVALSAKPGLTDKAMDWINRLRGKGQN